MAYVRCRKRTFQCRTSWWRGRWTRFWFPWLLRKCRSRWGRRSDWSCRGTAGPVFLGTNEPRCCNNEESRTQLPLWADSNKVDVRPGRNSAVSTILGLQVLCHSAAGEGRRVERPVRERRAEAVKRAKSTMLMNGLCCCQCNDVTFKGGKKKRKWEEDDIPAVDDEKRQTQAELVAVRFKSFRFYFRGIFFFFSRILQRAHMWKS